MSRQFAQNQRTRVVSTSNNPYQGTTSTLPLPHSFANTLPLAKDTNVHLKCTGSIRGVPCPLEQDACFTDEAFTDHSYYDYYDQDHGYQTSPTKHKGLSNSSESASELAPYYEYEEIASRRHSRNNFTQQSSLSPVKDSRRIYPSDIDKCVEQRFIQEPVPITAQAAYRNQTNYSRASDTRSRSSLSSTVPSAVVYGCGGKCQTFENVCYYFLQVAFTMGILIGISLGIAGWVLRKSAARNLQVLLYIGAMLSLVSALLLGIQCNARSTARLRQRALRNAKRAPIQMDTLQSRMVTAQPLIGLGTDNVQRGLPVTLVQLPGPGPVLQVQRPYRESIVDQQGIPWWRRKDLR